MGGLIPSSGANLADVYKRQKRNRGLNSSFIVRKISSGEGVERTFQTHSPLVAAIEVKRRGDVRRAKLYYLRERSGKSARIKEKLVRKAPKTTA